MICSLYFAALGLWVAVMVYAQDYWSLLWIIPCWIFGLVMIAPRKVSKDTKHNLKTLSVLYAHIEDPRTVCNPRVKQYLLGLLSGLAISTCKDGQISYNELHGLWVEMVAESRKEVQDVGNT